MSDSSQQTNSFEYAETQAALEQRHQQELEQLYELIKLLKQQRQENSQLQQGD